MICCQCSCRVYLNICAHCGHHVCSLCKPSRGRALPQRAELRSTPAELDAWWAGQSLDAKRRLYAGNSIRVEGTCS